MFYVYMLRSESTGRYYYGHTQNLQDRLYRHQHNGSKSTRLRGPWVLIGYITTGSRAEATQIEKRIKNFRSPERALDYIRQHGELCELL
jgi:putative endonuclease